MAVIKVSGSNGRTFNVTGGTQAPNGLVYGYVGDLYIRDNNGTGELWQKGSGDNTQTGWAQVGGGGGAVSSIIAGAGISISPSGGTGNVTITNTGNIVQTVTVPISSAQLLSADTVPIQLLPAKAGVIYQILSIREDYTLITSPYTGGYLAITQDDTTSGVLFYDAGYNGNQSLITNSQSSSGFFAPAVIGEIANNSTNAVRGDALTLYVTGGPALSGGSGTANIVITYIET